MRRMRSSVSVILSDPVPDTTMAFPDYAQTCADHARLLVLITRIGHQISEDTFSEVFSVIEQVREVQIHDKHGGSRTIGVRYTASYPLENNEWGEFQAHRKVLGVISLGTCTSQIELNELCRLHEAFKAKYSTTLYDTRCVVLCERPRGGQRNGEVNNDLTCTTTTVSSSNGDVDVELEKEIQANRRNSAGTAPSEEKEEEEGVQGGLDKPPSWFQPQNHKTRLLQFHGAKYSAGLKTDIQDFIGSLFWILESKRVEWSREGVERVPLLCAPFERKDFVGLDMESRNNRKRVLGRQKKHLGDLSLQAGLPAEAWNYYQVGCDVLRPANDWLWLAGCLEGLCSVSVLLQEKQEKGALFGSTGLSWEEMVERYRECVHHYAKYKHAGIIETEASLKAVAILIKQRSYLLASEFLQNVVFINLQLSDQEKIQRFLALSKLYSQIGFRRKAAFFERVAAMRCVAPQNQHHDWASCYSLMLTAVKGYSLDLTTCDTPERGWPALQVQLLQELVGTSRKMGAHAASTRHMAFLLQCLYPWLSSSERQDLASQLSVLSQRAPSTHLPLTLESGLVLPPVNLYCLPQVVRLECCPLPSHLLPFPSSKEKSVSGPFLFTPIQNLGAGSARSSGRAKAKTLTWVQGDRGEVLVEAVNTLGTPLHVADLRLLVEGVAADLPATTVLLEAGPAPRVLSLACVPRSPGSLRVLGFSHTVLGVNSLCHLSNLSCCEDDVIKVEVIPALPELEVWVEREEAASGAWSRVNSVSLYNGETLPLRLQMRNSGSVAVESLEVQWSCEEGGGEPPHLSVETGQLAASLPLPPGQLLTAPLVVRGQLLTCRADDCLSVAGSDSRWSASGLTSLTSRLSAAQSLPGQLLPTTHSGDPSLLSQHSESSGPESVASVLRLKVEVRGAEASWCRRAESLLAVAQLPSLAIARWDVLPGDRANNCFLVLDLLNRMGEEMELTYAGRKQILIEAGDTCRVPIPVEKCSFSESLDWRENGEEVRQYMEERVHLNWALGEGEDRREGVASLGGVAWTEWMLELVRLPPLAGILRVGGSECSEVEARAGHLILVEVELANRLLEPVADCSLLVSMQQEALGLATVGTLGSPGLTLSGELAPDARLAHTARLLPLSPGHYTLDAAVSVLFRGKLHSWRLPPVTVCVVL